MTVRPSTTQPIGSDGSTHQHFAGPFILDEELMIVNGNGDDGASTIKGEAFLWNESWAKLQFQCRGVIKNL
jgi:hypothetical protein